MKAIGKRFLLFPVVSILRAFVQEHTHDPREPSKNLERLPQPVHFHEVAWNKFLTALSQKMLSWFPKASDSTLQELAPMKTDSADVASPTWTPLQMSQRGRIQVFSELPGVLPVIPRGFCDHEPAVETAEVPAVLCIGKPISSSRAEMFVYPGDADHMTSHSIEGPVSYTHLTLPTILLV